MDPAAHSTVTVAVAQASSSLGQTDRNLLSARRLMRKAAEAGASLVVFPECFLTGYVVESRAEAESIALRHDGAEIGQVHRMCAEFGLHASVGYLERRGSRLYNTASLFGPDGEHWAYRKRHLPYLGADRFVDRPTDTDPPVFPTRLGPIGIAICYEIRFPEVIRTLALAGADLVLLPTAWPTRSHLLAEHFAPVRAAENFVYLLVADRKDRERDTEFLGGSQIVDPLGTVLASAEAADEVVFADVELDRPRDKRIVFDAGRFEISPWADRRPETYLLTDQSQHLPT